MKKLVGKKAEPSGEELEFIYSLLAKLSDSEVLEDMQATAFPLRSKGFIKRRRKEFNAAKRVRQEQIHKEGDPLIAKRREEHFGHLANIANALLSARDHLWAIRVYPNGEYGSYAYGLEDDEDTWGCSRQQVGIDLRESVDIALGRTFESWEDPECNDWDFDCLVSHLKAEYGAIETSGFFRVVEENPFGLLDLLRVVARRKTFKGTCPVCKDW